MGTPHMYSCITRGGVCKIDKVKAGFSMKMTFSVFDTAVLIE